MQVAWDYTTLAQHYDKRADYAPAALDRLIADTGLKAGATVADLGAGTGKLALPLSRRGFKVRAVEPNDAMRAIGVENARGLDITWREGTGEATGLPAHEADLVTFGSSFNVVDQPKALIETARLLKPRGWLACLWNHRDLDDPTQRAIEAIITSEIAGYDYGKRREDPSPAIAASGLFEPARHVEAGFVVDMPTADVIEAWRSHGTLQRQAGARFDAIVARIAALLAGKAVIPVPYHTRLWFARLR
jgi:SAM-dependent methyltransferase